MTVSELMVDHVGYWSKSVKFAVVIVLSVLLMCIGYWLIVDGDIEQYTMLKIQEISLRNEFELKHDQAIPNQIQITGFRD